MNSMFKKWIASSMALAIAVSMGVTVSAKPQSSKNLDLSKIPASSATTPAQTAATAFDYIVNTVGKTVQFIKMNKVAASHDVKLATGAKAPDVNVVISSQGNLCLNFKKADGKTTNVSLGQQANVVLQGDYNTLTIDSSVVGGRSFEVAGNVTTLNVNAPVAVSVGSTAVLNSLKVGNSNAVVTVESGAKVSAAAASNVNAIVGVSNVGTMAEVTTSILGGTAASSSDPAGVYRTNGGLSVEMEDAATKQYTDSIVYQPGNVITIVPKKNQTFENIIKDIKLVVKKTDSGNVVPGQWKYSEKVTPTNKAVPGSYKYLFTPYQQYKGFHIIIQVAGTGSAGTSVSTSPKISFYSGIGRGPGGTVDVDITLPAGVSKGDTLTVYAGNWSKTYDLVASNAGSTLTKQVEISESLAKNSKVSVYCSLSSGGNTLKSNTISYTYNEEGDTKTLKKPGLSLSSSHGNGEFTAQVTLPASVSSGDEIVITGVRSGSSREAGSKRLTSNDAGKTISIDCYVSGDPDDEVKVRAVLKSDGTSVSSDTKTYRIEE